MAKKLFDKKDENAIAKPTQVADKYLNNGFILTKKERKKAIRELKKKKILKSANKNRITLYRKHDDKIAPHYKITIVKFKNPTTKKKETFAIYPEDKNLGKGGNGTVKLMQNIKTGEWSALKVMNVDEHSFHEKEQEKNNLVRFGRSPGGHQLDEKHAGLILMSSDEQNQLDVEQLKKIQADNRNKPLVINQNGKILLYQFIDNHHQLQALNNQAFKHLQFPKNKQIAKLKSRHLTKGMYQELKNRNAYRSTAKKNKYLLAMKLASGEDLNKKFIHPYRDMEIYFNEDKFKVEFNHAKNSNDKRFFNSIHLVSVKDQPDKLQAIYFADGVQKSCYISKDAVFQAMQSFRHLNHFDQFPDDKNYYIQSMRLLENKESYETILQLIGLPKENIKETANEIAAIIISMIAAVKELHEAGLIHRDLKPEQFIYNPKTTELIDLGSAVTMEKPSESVQTGTTTAFLAPEMIKRARLNLNYQIMQIFYERWKKGDFTQHIPPEKNDYETFKAFHKAQNNKNVNAKYYTEFMEEDKKNIRANKTIDYTTASDIYALGISIGQIYGLVDRLEMSVAFNLKPPVYLEGEVNKSSDQVYVIKDFENAKKNNIYQLGEQELKELVTMLKSMTDVSPNNRPDLQAVEKFFKTFHAQLANKATQQQAAPPFKIPDTMPDLPTPPRPTTLTIPAVLPPLPSIPKQSTASIFAKMNINKESIAAQKAQEASVINKTPTPNKTVIEKQATIEKQPVIEKQTAMEVKKESAEVNPSHKMKIK